MRKGRRSASHPQQHEPQTRVAAQKSAPLQIILALAVTFALALLVMHLQGCALSSKGEEGDGGAGGNFLNQVAPMQVGDVHTLNFANGKAEVSFAAGAENHRYILALTPGLSGGNVSIQEGGSGTFAYTADPPSVSPPNINANPAASDDPTHLWFRNQESLHSASQVPSSGAGGGSSGGGYLAGTSGSQNFKVLTSTGGSPSFTTISANLVGSGSEANVYLDENADPLTAQQQAELEDNLDNVAQTLIQAFGAPSDINGDGKINFVLTPLLNNLNLSGYFWSGDLNLSEPAGNDQEVVFLVAPDSSEYYGGFISFNDTLRRVLPGVGAHEFQHLLNFNHKFGGMEDPTVNEGLSHAVEEMVAKPEELRYKQEACINSIATVNLGAGLIDLATRGCAGLIFQHYCEQQGDLGTCLANFVTTSQTGWQNAALVAGGDLGRAIAEFLAGLVVSGTNLNSTSPKRFAPLGTNEYGDITGFHPFTSYNDFQTTHVGWVNVDTSALNLPYNHNFAGFAGFVEISGAATLTIQMANFNHVGGALIRIEDAGSDMIGPSP